MCRCRKFPPQLKEEELNATEDCIVCAGRRAGAIFTSNYDTCCLFPFLCLSEGWGREEKKRQNVTFDICSQRSRQSPRVPWCQMTSRLSGVTRQPCGSPRPLHPCHFRPHPTAQQPQIVIPPAFPVTFKDYGANPHPPQPLPPPPTSTDFRLLPPQGIPHFSDPLNSFTSFYELHLLIFSFFFCSSSASPPHHPLSVSSKRRFPADSFLSSFPSDALQGIVKRKSCVFFLPPPLNFCARGAERKKKNNKKNRVLVICQLLSSGRCDAEMGHP